LLSPGQRTDQHYQELGPGRVMEIYNGNITGCLLTTGNCPIMPQCGKEGVIIYRLHFHDVKLN